MTDFVSYLPALATVAGAVLAGGVAAYAARTAANISHANKIADFRQAWIDALRSDIVDFCAAAELWMVKKVELDGLTNPDKGRERSELVPLATSARTILNRVALRINPKRSRDQVEDEHFLAALCFLIEPGSINPQHPEASWLIRSDAVVEQARLILKREWSVTKRVIPYRVRLSKGL